jgi:glucoamylase
MSEAAEGLLEWTAKQCRFSATAMLRAVSATTLVKVRPALGQTIRPVRGSILASPEMAAYDPYPDYFFHWLRDSAIVADALREAIEAGILEPTAVEHLVDFVAFSLELCRRDGPAFLQGDRFPKVIEPSFRQHVRSREEIADVAGDRVLGEPRFNADGSFDVMKWARPQNDGPALRALTVMRCFTLDGFRERGGAAAMTLLRYDLDYTLSHWRLPCFDLWEENSGFHYHTRLIQYAALAAGAAFMTTEGHAGRATKYSVAACELFAELDAHFEPDDGVYRGRLAEEENARGAPPPRRLDISVVLAVIQTGRRAGAHSVVDPKVLATMTALERLFERQYPINCTRPADCAPALGRYADDSYFSGGAYYFSTLGAAQFCFLLAQAAAEGAEVAVTRESRATLAALLGAPTESLMEGVLAVQLQERLAWASLRRGDMFLSMVRRYTPASRELSEQFDQNDGAANSARNLSWSYACFITAVAARRRAVHVIGV